MRTGRSLGAWHRWRAGAAPPRAVDPTTRARLQDAVRALGEEADANRAELERRAMAYDDPGCPPDRFGSHEPGTSERRTTDRGRHDRSWRERDDRDDR
jgi:hypothetical protein